MPGPYVTRQKGRSKKVNQLLRSQIPSQNQLLIVGSSFIWSNAANAGIAIFSLNQPIITDFGLGVGFSFRETIHTAWFVCDNCYAISPFMVAAEISGGIGTFPAQYMYDDDTGLIGDTITPLMAIAATDFDLTESLD